MRFLLLNQFYPPDTAPTGWYLHGLGRALVARGHSVRVFCSRRPYDGGNSLATRENLDGVEVLRLPASGFGRRGFVGRMADYGSFYVFLTARLLFDRSKPDVIVSLTTPPYIGLLGKLAALGHRCRHAHWIMDVYPDVMRAHGMARNAGWGFKLLRRMTRFQLRGAQTAIALGPKMAEIVEGYASGNGPLPQTVDWIPLWSDPELTPWPEDQSNPLRAERAWAAKDVVFLYSGNMGLGHRFTEFLAAARQLGGTGPRWVFSGGGKRRDELETFARLNGLARIEFLDYVPQSLLRAHLGAADVHLASLDSTWQGLIVPSKIQASFAAARPVLFVGGRGCETAAWIHESGGGWVVDQDDLSGLLKAIEEALDPEERRRRGRAALAFARRNFQMAENCGRIVELLEAGVGSRLAGLLPETAVAAGSQ